MYVNLTVLVWYMSSQRLGVSRNELSTYMYPIKGIMKLQKAWKQNRYPSMSSNDFVCHFSEVVITKKEN